MSNDGKHWRVVIQVQEVTPAQPGQLTRGIGHAGAPATERKVHEVAGLNVAADSESAAFKRAISALQALRPQIDVTSIDEMPPHHFPGER